MHVPPGKFHCLGAALWCHCLECLLYHLQRSQLVAVGDQVLELQLQKFELYFAKECFNRVKIWTISQIKHDAEIKLIIYLLSIWMRVNPKLVQEETDLLPLQLLPKLSQGICK